MKRRCLRTKCEENVCPTKRKQKSSIEHHDMMYRGLEAKLDAQYIEVSGYRSLPEPSWSRETWPAGSSLEIRVSRKTDISLVEESPQFETSTCLGENKHLAMDLDQT